MPLLAHGRSSHEHYRDPVTLISILDRYTAKVSMRTKSESSTPRLSEVRALQTDRHARKDATENVAMPHSRWQQWRRQLWGTGH